MKLPDFFVRICHKCKGKSIFKVKELKRGKPSANCDAERKRIAMGQRGNLGRYSKAPVKRVKKSKKPFILLTCTTCSRGVNLKRPRAIKIQVVQK